MRAEINKLLTETGSHTPLGQLLRRYWQPAALVKELETDRPLRPLRLLGEDLVLFRDDSGRYALMDRHCAHRGADLSYGRLEDGGLRCPFHGWLFDAGGQCLEQPAEPQGSDYYQRIRQPTYPCVEKNGIIFTYMGPGSPPEWPPLDCFIAPDQYTFAFKGMMACNWLQALEVGIDPAHASFLHRFLQDEDTSKSYGKQFRAAVGASDMPMTQILRQYPRPEIRVENTGYGLRLTALRNLANQGMHVRVTHQVFPQAIIIPMSNDMTISQWHVPIDDTRCYWYAIFTSYADAVDRERMYQQRVQLYEPPDYVPRINKHNNYGFDADEQRHKTYTGMGDDINVHDQWAVESQGAIQDRTREHLAQSDIGIIRYRRLLRSALDALASSASLPLYTAPGKVVEFEAPAAIDTITPAQNWEAGWRTAERRRREQCAWLSDLN